MGQALITRRGVPMLAPDVDDGYEQLINYTMLYDSGDECEEITGGWSAVSQNSSYPVTLQKTTDYLYVKNNHGRDNCDGAAMSNNKINVSGYSKCFTVVNGIRNNTNSAYNPKPFLCTLRASKSLPSDVIEYLLHPDTSTSEFPKGTSVRDISEISSEGYIALEVGGGATSTKCWSKYYALALVGFDDYQTLCTKAGVAIPSSLESLLADTTSLATIFNNEDAVKFMVAQCTGDFMVSVIANSTALGLLKASPYYTTVQANEHWVKFLAMVA